MSAHIDEPQPGLRVDPGWFYVCGWLWLDAAHPDIATVEAWCGDTLIGQTTELSERIDVIASLGLPADTRTGFELFACHPAAEPGQNFDLRRL